MASDLQPGTYDGPNATLRYALQTVPRADSLLVAFPKLRAGAARPPVGLRRVLGDIRAHRLYLGADQHTFVGPQRRMYGMHAGLELIERETTSLGVMRERVVCLGTSMGAVCAMVAGLMYGAGRVVVGAAPVHCGTALQRFVGAKYGRKAAAPEVLALVEAPGG
ncbi:MAG: hypothetical protein ACJ734_08915, partial [Gaiellaceae bacterium]